MAAILSGIYFNYSRVQKKYIVALLGFFQVASLFSTRVESKKVGVDIEKALELDNRRFFFIFQPDFNIKISPTNAIKYLVA